MTVQELISKIETRPGAFSVVDSMHVIIAKAVGLALEELGIEVRESDGTMMLGTMLIRLTPQM